MPDSPSHAARSYTVAAKPSDIDRAVFLGAAVTDNIYTALMAMAAELWAVRRRQKVVEAVLQRRGLITEDLVETFTATAAEAAQWQAERDQFIKMIYEPFTKQGDIPYYKSLEFEPKS